MKRRRNPYDKGMVRVVDSTFYRGTRHKGQSTRMGVTSWTDSIDVAAVYAADPAFHEWQSGSTVHAARIQCKAIDWSSYGHQCDFPSLIASLGYGKPKGMTELEARSVLRFLHKRALGQLKGYGEFIYEAFESNEARDDETSYDVAFNFGDTQISRYDDDWDGEPGYDDDKPILLLDTFAFADCPQVHEICRRVGLTGMLYTDCFGGGETAARKLFGAEDYEDLKGVDEEDDEVEGMDPVWVHATLRPLTGAAVTPLWSKPAAQVEHARNR
jgi:hypothetical protein